MFAKGESGDGSTKSLVVMSTNWQKESRSRLLLALPGTLTEHLYFLSRFYKRFIFPIKIFSDFPLILLMQCTS